MSEDNMKTSSTKNAAFLFSLSYIFFQSSKLKICYSSLKTSKRRKEKQQTDGVYKLTDNV
jgi:hypothetical protein